MGSETAVLELRGVTKRWRGSAALDGVDLALPRGAIIGLVGPSGAGKTTAMRVALGLLRPDRGTAHVFGAPAAAIARHAGRVGLVLDGPALEGGLTVAANLTLHRLRHGAAARDTRPWLERLGLGGLTHRRAARLSQGEAQRVALARALLLEPDLLVLDEPVAHLDPALTVCALDLVREAARERGCAALVSSHQLAELERVVTHLVLLHQGRVLLAGELAALLGQVTPAVRIAARPVEQAQALLAAHPAVAAVERLRTDGIELLRAELRPGSGGDAGMAALNAALHAGGIQVSLLAPERPTLVELFQRTLLRAGDGAGPGMKATAGGAG